jgi:hypothetical protein
MTDTAPKLTLSAVQEAIGPLDNFAHLCHGASLALVRSGLLPEGSRVARGSARGVGAQHSWVLVAPQNGPYDRSNWVVDVTLWSYVPEAPRLYVGKASKWPHIPYGSGSIWRGPHRPPGPEGDVIEVDVPPAGRMFLDVAAPGGLDEKGWHILLNGPMEGWPSAEVVLAAYHTPALRNLIPIDLVGMLTDLNPNGLYF